MTSYLGSEDEPEVEPAAVLRTGGGPVCGFFVARGSEQLYVGTFARRISIEAGIRSSTCTGPSLAQVRDPGKQRTEELPSRLIALPRAELTDVAIGPNLPLREEETQVRAATMALDLCERRLARAVEPDAVSCSRKDAERLRDLVRTGPASTEEPDGEE